MFAKPLQRHRAVQAAVLLVTTFLVLAGQGSAALADKPQLASRMTAYVVAKQADGKEVLAPAKRVSPGEVIEYRVRHKNQSREPVRGLIVQGPIPRGTVYVANSATSRAKAVFEVLVPGEAWQRLPAYKTIVDKDGKKRRVRAHASDYRAIRWRMAEPLGAGATIENHYRVRVLK